MNPDTPLAQFPTRNGEPSAVSQLYLAYARLFEYPSDAMVQALSDGDISAELAELHQDAEVEIPALKLDDVQGIEQTYISVFEIGTPESQAPLYESAYERLEGEDRRAVLEDLMRFYEFFDLDLGERPSEQPDHLTVELEFMAVLAQMEAQSKEPAEAAQPFRLAQRDFLTKHIRVFAEAIARRASDVPVYSGLLKGLTTLLNAEQQRLERICGPAHSHSGPHPGNA